MYIFLFFSSKEVELSLNDWLDGLQKTVDASIQKAQDEESQGIEVPSADRLIIKRLSFII